MGCRIPHMTTEEYRRSYDYREEYFKWNPGVCGYIWFCSQCHKPLFGKSNVVIDHIVPLNKGGRNHVSNCTACCQPCNSAKSDKCKTDGLDGLRYYKRGKRFKRFETIIAAINRTGGSVFSLPFSLIYMVVGLPGYVIKTGQDVAHGRFKFNLDLSPFGFLRGIFSLFIFAVMTLFKVLWKVLSLCIKVVYLPLKYGNYSCRFIFVAFYLIVIFSFLAQYTTLLDSIL